MLTLDFLFSVSSEFHLLLYLFTFFIVFSLQLFFRFYLYIKILYIKTYFLLSLWNHPAYLSMTAQSLRASLCISFTPFSFSVVKNSYKMGILLITLYEKFWHFIGILTVEYLSTHITTLKSSSTFLSLPYKNKQKRILIVNNSFVPEGIFMLENLHNGLNIANGPHCFYFIDKNVFIYFLEMIFQKKRYYGQTRKLPVNTG